jgi:signal transduction histidine kinase
VSTFLEENQTLILFAQGLVFFALGFAVWIQRRRATRLTLTSSLIWLAAFAFVESLAVWGYVFVPIQDSYVGHGVIDVLIVLRALLQTAAFLFLMAFGLRLLGLGSMERAGLTAVACLLWVGILGVGAIIALHAGWGVGQWERSVEAAARHLLLLPGALLAAWGLWRHREELSSAGMPGIKPYAGAAAAVLVAYAVAAGIVVDYTAWAPGGALADTDRYAAMGLWLSAVRGLLGLVLAVLAIKLLETFDVEVTQRMEALDRARAVAEERARFGRDLHDGTIQSLYAAGLHLESLAIRSDDQTVREEVREVVAGLNRTIAALRDYIRALRQPPSTPARVAERLEELARRFSTETGLQVAFAATGLGASGPLPHEAAEHLEQILREALSNAARHAGPCDVRVRLAFAPDELDLEVVDDGCGLGECEGDGNGMKNIRERVRRLGGRAAFERRADGGTRVALAIPLDIEAPAREPDLVAEEAAR